MSDFLNKFSKNNYETLLEEEQKNEQDVETEDNVEAEIVETVVKVESPSATSNTDGLPTVETSKQTVTQHSVVTPTRMASASELNNAKVGRASVRVEEVVEKDPSYQKKQRIKLFSIIGGAIFAVLAVIGGFYMLNSVTMPNFINKQITEARTWALKNRIELDITEEFSLEKDAGIVFEQGREDGKKIMKGSVVTLKVSRGADPDEAILVPDFKDKTLRDIEKWKEENRADNAKIVREFHDTIADGQFLRMEFRNTSLTNTTYLRKDTLTIYVSRGKEVFEKNINVPDFTNKMKGEVESWATTNDINVTYNEVSSNSIEAGMIVAQSVVPNEKLAKKDSLSVEVSVGKSVVVPSYYGRSQSEAMTLEPGIQVTIIEEYNVDVNYGTLIYQTVHPWTELTGADERSITLYYSLGRPYLGEVVGMNEYDLFKRIADEYNAKGCNITFTTHYINSPAQPGMDGGAATAIQKGQIIRATKGNEYIGLNTHFDIYVSTGRIG
jgi:Uncharacterized protein conserved in bacteria